MSGTGSSFPMRLDDLSWSEAGDYRILHEAALRDYLAGTPDRRHSSAASRPPGRSPRSATAISISSSSSRGRWRRRREAGAALRAPRRRELAAAACRGPITNISPCRIRPGSRPASCRPCCTTTSAGADGDGAARAPYHHAQGAGRGNPYPRFVGDITTFLARTLFFSSDLAVSAARKKQGIAAFAGNHALCKITEDLIFTDPYRMAEQNRWTAPWLDASPPTFVRTSTRTSRSPG